MNDPALETQVAAAKAYEELFVPALFEQWTSKLVDAAEVVAGQSVLDVACGTGVLAHAALQRVGPGGYVAAVDPNAGMLAVAKELAPSVDWRQGVAESMPFAADSFDAVVSQFGLMFMDRVVAIREMLRVLKPSGHLAVAVWDAVGNIPAFADEGALLERLAGPRAAEALSAPFVLGDRELLTGIFNEAGAKAITARTIKGVARFPSIRFMVEADLRGWLPIRGVNLSEEEIERILAEAEDALGSYATAEGRAIFDVTAHLVTARKS